MLKKNLWVVLMAMLLCLGMSSVAMGLPTMLLRPSTTQCLPRVLMP